MSEPTVDTREQALRQFALMISKTINAEADVLERRAVDIPDLSSATFETSTISETQVRPRAYRHVENIESSTLPKQMRSIVDQLRILEALLVWGHAPGYNEDNVGREFLDNYCHALLTSAVGPLKCAAPLGSFVLFGPNTFYKEHHHEPNEVYLALTGGGRWKVGDHPWTQLNPGQTIFIPSNALHSIHAGDEPLLTFSFWLEPGDIHAINI